jgi:hypothetical protein
VGGYAWSKYGFVFEDNYDCQKFYNKLAEVNRKIAHLISDKDMYEIIARSKKTKYEIYDFIQYYQKKYGAKNLKDLIIKHKLSWDGIFSEIKLFF